MTGPVLVSIHVDQVPTTRRATAAGVVHVRERIPLDVKVLFVSGKVEANRELAA